MEDIETIIKNKTTCIFISPHFDDAAFSAGALLSELCEKVDIIVINIFTSSGDGRNTLSAKQYLRQCKASNAKSLYKTRIKEDAAALSLVGAKIYNLNYTEAMWRKKMRVGKTRKILAKFLPEFDRVYATYKFGVSSGKFMQEEMRLKKQIANKIKEIVQKEKNVQVFCPIGFGGHVDHILTRDACFDAFGQKLIYWSDTPYNASLGKANDFIKDHNLNQYSFEIKSDNKEKLTKLYASQFKSTIDDDRILYKPEIFYFMKAKETKLRVEVKNILDDKMLIQWQKLWEESPLKNCFNSPTWFLSSRFAFGYKEVLIIACYWGNKPVAILPLIKSKKLGLSAYMTPGEQYYDRSSLLLMKNDTKIITVILDKLKTIGNFYLAEIDEYATRNIFSFTKDLDLEKSSSSCYLPVGNDPYRFISTKNKKAIKKISEAEQGNFELKTYLGNLDKYLPTFIEIESMSSKVTEKKNVLSNPKLIKLYKTLNKFNQENFLMFVLYYKNEAICYRFGQVYDKTFLNTDTAYKDSYNHLVPGKIIAHLMLAQMQKLGIEYVDFARGDSRFKRDLTPFIYDQYAVFYAKNFATRFVWRTNGKLKNYLEKHQTLFEIIRKNKLTILEGVSKLAKRKDSSSFKTSEITFINQKYEKI